MNDSFRQRLNLIKSKSFVMWTFLLIQTIVFLLMQFSPDGAESNLTIVNFGGMYKGLVLDQGEYWRFITPIFVHIGFSHFILNSIVLYFLGDQVERMYGHLRFLMIYLIAGIAGNLLSFAMQPNVISAGDSTSLFGLFGAFIVLRHFYPENPGVKVLTLQYVILVGAMLVFNLFDPHVDIWGHLGGLIGGLLAAIIASVPERPLVSKLAERLVALLLLAGFVIALLAIGFYYKESSPFLN